MTSTSPRPVVLVVDDSATNRKLLSGPLESEGYRILQAADGREALQLVERQPVDVILLDLMMPGMDGFEVLTQLRADSRTAEIPVLVITAHDERSIKLQALDAGAEDFLTKPIDALEIRIRVRNMLRLKRKTDELTAANTRLSGDLSDKTDKLERTSAFLRETLDALTARIAILDEHDHVVFANLEWNDSSHAGTIEQSEHLLKSIGIETTADQDRQIREGIQRVRSGKLHEYYLEFATTSHRWWRLRATDFTIAERNYTVLFLRDVTEEHAAARQLFLAQSALDNAPDAVLWADDEGRILYANNEASRSLGHTRDELLRLRVPDLDPWMSADEWPGYRKASREPGGVTYETGRRRKDGTEFPVEVSAWVVEHEGESVGVGFVRDITARQTAEEQLRRLALVAETTDYAVVITDPQRRIEWVNPGFVSMSGYSIDEVVGRDPGSFLHGPCTDRESVARLNSALEARQGMRCELMYYHRAGHELWVEVNVQPVLDDTGHIERFISIESDVTARKKAEQEVSQLNAELEQKVAEQTAELRQTNYELQRAAEFKDQFLASMSHELRTPLTGILGLSEAMLEKVFGELNERQTKFVRQIHESGQHLLELINDILDLSKIEAGRMDLQVEPVTVEDLCQAALRLTKPQAISRGHRIYSTVEPPGMVVLADKRRLKQMLVNLLSNAIKFTPSGKSIGLDVKGDVDAEVARFTVWDEGIGIPDDQVDRLFQPFVQLDGRLSREYEGTGLGLYLVQRMARMHSGTVDVKSTPGKGSQFTIAIPWEPSRSVSQRIQRSTNIHSGPRLPGQLAATVLLADDNDANAEIIAEYLHEHGFDVIRATDGEQAVQTAVSARPDVILMDIQMPRVDGLEAIRRIRAHDAVNGIPIVALTALAMRDDRQRCLSAGATEYLAKPVSLVRLLEVVRREIGRTGERHVPGDGRA